MLTAENVFAIFGFVYVGLGFFTAVSFMTLFENVLSDKATEKVVGVSILTMLAGFLCFVVASVIAVCEQLS